MQENFSLKPFNTFSVEAKAKYFTEVTSVEELKEALHFANSNTLKLPILFLGGGSNILFTQDFDGLAIKLNLQGISEEIINENEVLVTAKAGENWHNFVMHCLKKLWWTGKSFFNSRQCRHFTDAKYRSIRNRDKRCFRKLQSSGFREFRNQNIQS